MAKGTGALDAGRASTAGPGHALQPTLLIPAPTVLSSGTQSYCFAGYSQGWNSLPRGGRKHSQALFASSLEPVIGGGGMAAGGLGVPGEIARPRRPGSGRPLHFSGWRLLWPLALLLLPVCVPGTRVDGRWVGLASQRLETLSCLPVTPAVGEAPLHSCSENSPLTRRLALQSALPVIIGFSKCRCWCRAS